MSTERRTYNIGEFRADDEGKITGYAAVFNSLSEDLGGFREIIRPGAFAKTINDGDVRALWEHNSQYVIGRTNTQMREGGKATLRLIEDERGLKVEISPPDTTWARDLVTSIKRGDISQMSFGFEAVKERFRNDKVGLLRELFEVKLFDVSPVAYPAYVATEVQARALQFLKETTEPGELEAHSDEIEPGGNAPHSDAMENERRRVELLRRASLMRLE